MAIDAKMRLMDGLKKKLADKVVLSDMETVLDSLTEVLSHYQITVIEDDYGENDDMLDAYLNAKEIEGKSPATIARYKYVIQRLLDFVNVPTRAISVYDVRKYLGAEKARGISETTLEGNRQTFNAYFSWLHREGLITANPIGNIGTIKSKKEIKVPYSEVDVEKMKICCQNIRDRAIIVFLLSTGCRISEVTGMNRDSVDFQTMECRVLGKGNKERIVYLDPVASMTLKEYLNTRNDTSEALFVGKGDKRLQPGGVRNMLKNIERISGVNHVHPHKFRRTLATNLIRRGMPLEEVAAILGHDKLDTTMRYVVLDKSDIKNAYRRYAS